MTGVTSLQEVWNFPLKADEDGGGYERVASLRATELLEEAALNLGAARLLRQPRGNDAAAAAPGGSRPATNGGQGGALSSASDAAEGRVSGTGEADESPGPAAQDGAEAAQQASAIAQDAAAPAVGAAATTASASAPGSGSAASDVYEALAAGRQVAPAQLLYDDLEVTTRARKLTQAEIYRRMARDLRAR